MLSLRSAVALRRALVTSLAIALAAVAACAAPHGHSLIGDPSPIPGLPTVPPTTAPPSTEATFAPGTTPTTSSTTTTQPPAQPPRPYAVGWVDLHLVDSARGRTLPTLVFYPATGTSPAAEIPNGPALFHGWPLVVFAEGYNTTPLTYHDLIHHLASAGFVVAAPSFPFETAGGPLNENDLQNEPADIRFVITQVEGEGGALAGMVDPGRVALVGHSDGGEAVLGAAYLASQADPRVGPVVAMSAKGFLNGGQFVRAPRHDLLVIQGTADTINPPAAAQQMYAAAPSPKAYLTLFGAGHLPPIADANQWRPVVEATIVDWLDNWFPTGIYHASAVGRLGHDANIPGVSAIQLG